MKIYGIKNCDTVKKALTWLQGHDVPYEFHDYKKLGIDEETLRTWAETKGWENLINKSGTTWRKLDPAIRDSVTGLESAIKLMAEYTSVIRRPLIESGKDIVLGFNEREYGERFSSESR
jgi:arsenate reductase (glutaredoxin)